MARLTASTDYSPYTAIPLATQTVIVLNSGAVTSDVSVLCFVVGPNPGMLLNYPQVALDLQLPKF